jgi:hypothetical protein
MSKKETYYIVQYNDRYGNGNDKVYECIVKNKTGFKKWLKEHNAQRRAMGESGEHSEEFDLIPVNLYQ